jgi:hypothetical protein
MGATVPFTRGYFLLVLLVAGAGIGILAFGFHAFPTSHWIDSHDIRIYYQQSRWVAGQGTLYRDIASEYPPAANVLFAAVRLLSDHLGGGVTAYIYVWSWAGWLVYLGMGHLIATRVSKAGLWIWLAPAPLLFAATRFDVYPAAATLLALLALRDGRLLAGALWLGISIALKGYALFLLPAFLIFVLLNRTWRTAFVAAALSLGPCLLANLVVFAYAGWDGMLSPYRFHAHRANFGESTYDAFYYLFPFLFSEHPTVSGWVPGLLQIVCSLAAMALRPRSFDELVNAFLVALLGFMSFSVFYSPQYCLWLVPFACFSQSRSVWLQSVLFGWVTYLYFPVFHVNGAHKITLATAASAGFTTLRLLIFRACIIAVTLLRFGIMASPLRSLWSSRVGSKMEVAGTAAGELRYAPAADRTITRRDRTTSAA